MSQSVTQAVKNRKSTRAFLPDPVPEEVIREVLEKSLRAPSGGNVQPWHLYVVSGNSMKRFRSDLDKKMEENPLGEKPQYSVYPERLIQPYRTYRYSVGEEMYALLGISRDEKLKRLEWLQNNYRFFGAPVGIFCFIDRSMGAPQWSDLGMYLQTAMLLFEEAGYATCAQEAWSRWPEFVSGFVGAPEEQMLFCGLAVGKEDTVAPVNQLRTSRALVEDTVTFVS
jgi:nitroreductase